MWMLARKINVSGGLDTAKTCSDHWHNMAKRLIISTPVRHLAERLKSLFRRVRGLRLGHAFTDVLLKVCPEIIS